VHKSRLSPEGARFPGCNKTLRGLESRPFGAFALLTMLSQG
jgi:hypothetical protein